MSTTETKIKKEINAYLDMLKPELWHVPYPNFGGYGPRGVPDRLCCYRGVFLAFEVKRDGNTVPTQWQLRQLEAIRQAGGVAEVVWSVDQVKRIIEEMRSAK